MLSVVLETALKGCKKLNV